MKLYGLTGGIGMGKSAAASFLASKGLPVVDTDDLARQVVSPGEQGLHALTEAFGTGILAEDGTLARGKLAQLVFGDRSARERLERILHPLIRRRWQECAAGWQATGRAAGVVVIPLLYETGAEQFFESVICIGCSSAQQSARLRSRGWTAEQVAGRLSAQWPIERKMDRAQYVVWNDASLAILQAQLARVPPLKA